MGCAVSRREIVDMLGLEQEQEEGGQQSQGQGLVISFEMFFNLMKKLKHERRAISRMTNSNENSNENSIEGDNNNSNNFQAIEPPTDSCSGSEEKKDSSSPSQYGSFFNTATGVAVREQMLLDDPNFVPKKKGDVRQLSSEPIPQPAVLIRPRTSAAPQEMQAQAMTMTMFEPSTSTAYSNNNFDHNGNVYGARNHTAPGGISLSRGSSPSVDNAGGGIEQFTSLSKLSVNELKTMATAAGGGRNAVRAKSLLERAEGKRLREGERPADVDIHGEERESPVRYKELAMTSNNVDYMRVEFDAASGRRSPDNSIRSLTSSPVSVPWASSTLSVLPKSVECGEVEEGGWEIVMHVKNVSLEGVRFLVSVEGGSYVEVVEKPQGKVAAGMKCTFVLRMTGEVGDVVDSVVKISSPNDVAHIPVSGTFVKSGGGGQLGSLSKYVTRV